MNRQLRYVRCYPGLILHRQEVPIPTSFSPELGAATGDKCDDRKAARGLSKEASALRTKTFVSRWATALPFIKAQRDGGAHRFLSLPFTLCRANAQKRLL